MDLKNIKKFIELAKSEGASELKYEEKEVKISVNFGISQSQIMMPPSVNHSIPQAPVSAESAQETETEKYHLITSPFVGTFYNSAAPGKPNFVKVGDKVFSGQTLCILEAMKIMNEIEANISGEIVEICVENESLVEFGQTLFKIKA